MLEQEVDAVIVLEVAEPFYAVDQYYQDFAKVSDEEVAQLLKGNL